MVARSPQRGKYASSEAYSSEEYLAVVRKTLLGSGSQHNTLAKYLQDNENPASFADAGRAEERSRGTLLVIEIPALGFLECAEYGGGFFAVTRGTHWRPLVIRCGER